MKVKNILIVDDNRDFRHHLKNFLLTENGMRIIGEAADGEQAISEVNRNVPDVVLMDISMPGLNGFETTNRILEIYPEMKVIMLSVNENEEYQEAAKQHGACGYVVKKNMVKELIPKIEGLFLKGDIKSSTNYNIH